MKEPEIENTIIGLLKKIAPDAAPETLNPDDNICTILELDSFDYLQFIVSIDEKFGINTPEEDYGNIQTLTMLVAYLKHASKELDYK